MAYTTTEIDAQVRYGPCSYGLYSCGLYNYGDRCAGWEDPGAAVGAGHRRSDLGDNYYRHLGIADGMSLALVWACRYSK